MPSGLRNAPPPSNAPCTSSCRRYGGGGSWRISTTSSIFSKNTEEHVDHVDHIMGLLSHAGVKMKLKKCFFFLEEGRLTGELISLPSFRVLPTISLRAYKSESIFTAQPSLAVRAKYFLIILSIILLIKNDNRNIFRSNTRSHDLWMIQPTGLRAL